jgi:hypothetical protein
LYTARGNTHETVLLAKFLRISLRPTVIPLRQPPPVEAQQSAAPEKTAGSLAIVGIEQRKEAAGNDREDDENAWQALPTEALVDNRP